MAIDAKEVSSRVRALEKAVEQKDSAESIAAILKGLQRDIVPTRELLKVSRVATRRRRHLSG
jgi:transcription elongation factor S-II